MSRGHRRVGGFALACVLVATLVPGAPAIAAAPGTSVAGGQVLDDPGFDWSRTFYGPGLDTGLSATGSGGAAATAVWDDGDGAALYVGGWTMTAGEHVVNRIARWDGAGWSPLTGPDGTGVTTEGSGNPNIKALAVYQDKLIVAGYFNRAGGVPVDNIAQWDGERWSALPGGGVTGGIGVEALTVHDGVLVAGGSFTTAGGEPVARVAGWDGEQWSSYDVGVEGGSVFALESYQDDLYVGGSFTHAGGAQVGRIARWDAAQRQWHAVAGGANNIVRALYAHEGALYAGGNFTVIGDRTANHIARWDGSGWSALGGGMSGQGNPRVESILAYAGELVAAGSFQSAEGGTVNHIARWDGTGWSPLAGPGGAGADLGIGTLAAFEGRLVAGSMGFREIGGVAANYIAQWDGDGWEPLRDGPSNGLSDITSGIADVTAAVVWRGDLIVAGSFVRAGEVRANRIARWDGASWTPLAGTYGTGVSGTITALTEYDGDLIAAGAFVEAGGLTVNYIARYDGREWAPLVTPSGVGTDFPIDALATYDGALVAAGNFSQAGGATARHLAAWDGAGWAPLGGGTNGRVNALAVVGGDLILGGSFTEAGGAAANRVASWDGSGFTPLAGGFNGGVNVLTSIDGEIFAGGAFTQADGATVNRVARWDGTGWSALAGPDGTGVTAPVNALAGYHGSLYVGGRFAEAGGVTVDHLARWDGDEWSAIGEGEQVGVGAVTIGDVRLLYLIEGDDHVPDQLAVGGAFQRAGGSASWGFAVYGPTAPFAALTASPREVEFGALTAEETGTATVTLTATGTAPVTITELTEPAEPFAVAERDCPAATMRLEPAQSCTITYEFAPTSGGEYAEELPVTSDANPVSVSLRGLGLTAPPQIDVDPGEVAVSVPAEQRDSTPITLTNLGEAELSWRAAPEGFDAVGPPAAGLAPGLSAPEPAASEPTAPEPGNEVARADGAGTEAAGAADPGSPAITVGDEHTVLSHSESMAVSPQHAVTCLNVATGHSRAAGHLRAFHLPEFGVSDDFLVTDVTFGVQAANPEIGVEVNLYTLDGALRYENLHPLGSATGTVAGKDQGRLVTVPVHTVVPAGSTLVVELATADLLGTGWFLPGTNDQGESAPSYFASEACGVPEPTPLANVGFGYPDVHLAMSVRGRAPVDCGQPAWLAVAPAAGTVAGGGDAQVSLEFDTAGLAVGDEATATLCLVSDDPVASLVTVPVTVTVTDDDDPPGGPVVCDETITGVHAGALTVTEGVTCLAAGAAVLGEVNVSAGAGLVATAAVVQGPVSAVGAAVVDLSFTQVTGPVVVSGATGSVSLFASQVTGSVSVVNGAMASAAVVAGNTIIGSLSCVGNDPAPTDLGLANTATGGATGQCAAGAMASGPTRVGGDLASR
ncbi:hypothetical protein JQS43_19000 [Natronosporangium hydrolyticum]|uniref:Choice-of-anchor D domain-containing protein n=1 Tax=Natronosporangium hydrolyticum TaxID=2811111 RepID=A0A895YGJ0_9ACTN|nr:hypothetical protein [Natronosporangium hydrolyticum]QSB13646.1 hypothetical protein JQS43_19000 [Natronosporangium hydrolyticum]